MSQVGISCRFVLVGSDEGAFPLGTTHFLFSCGRALEGPSSIIRQLVASTLTAMRFSIQSSHMLHNCLISLHTTGSATVPSANIHGPPASTFLNCAVLLERALFPARVSMHLSLLPACRQGWYDACVGQPALCWVRCQNFVSHGSRGLHQFSR